MTQTTPTVGAMTGQVILSSDNQVAAEISSATQKFVLLYFWAPWCGPCRLTAPAVEAIAAKYAESLKVLKLEVDPNPASVAQYQIQGVPAFVLLQNGEVVATHEGAIAQPKLINFLETNGIA